MITSPSNPKVKLVRSLAHRRARAKAQQFVLEGVRLVEEAAQSGLVPHLVLYASATGRDERIGALLERLRAATPEVFEVSDAVMKAMSSAETPPGLVAVFPLIELPLPPQPEFVLILDRLRDPGNLGTILRSARAAGVDLVLCAPTTVDPHNDKVVRGAMGAHFRVPLRAMHDWEAIAALVRSIPRIYLADAHGEVEYTAADWSRPVALIVGGETEGTSDEARQLATARVRIPMRGGAESLNAAMAATVLLFHAARGAERTWN